MNGIYKDFWLWQSLQWKAFGKPKTWLDSRLPVVTPIFSGTQCNTGQLLCCGDRMDSTPKLRHSGIVSFYACVFLQKEWTEAEPQLPLERPTMGEAQVAHDGSFFLWGQWEAGEGAACRAHGSSDDPHVTSSHGPFSSFSVDEPRT